MNKTAIEPSNMDYSKIAQAIFNEERIFYDEEAVAIASSLIKQKNKTGEVIELQDVIDASILWVERFVVQKYQGKINDIKAIVQEINACPVECSLLMTISNDNNNGLEIAPVHNLLRKLIIDNDKTTEYRKAVLNQILKHKNSKASGFIKLLNDNGLSLDILVDLDKINAKCSQDKDFAIFWKSLQETIAKVDFQDNWFLASCNARATLSDFMVLMICQYLNHNPKSKLDKQIKYGEVNILTDIHFHIANQEKASNTISRAHFGVELSGEYDLFPANNDNPLSNLLNFESINVVEPPLD